jgi:predicted DNA-binding helix-hairpin-helix protein
LGTVEDGAEGAALAGRKVGGHIVSESRRIKWKEKFAPAGKTTQMIIGASPESDKQIVKLSEALYRRFTMKRVYFSAYIPVAGAPELPPLLTPPPLKREHRLYQADWLMRFYGFSSDEILTEDEPNLDYDLDPKVVWALRNIEAFPIEVNSASEAELLRIPGVGNVSVQRIMRHRRVQKVHYEDLKKMGVVLKRARFFITCGGRYYGGKEQGPDKLRTLFALEEFAASGYAESPALSPALPGSPALTGLSAPPAGKALDAASIRTALGGRESPQLTLFGLGGAL